MAITPMLDVPPWTWQGRRVVVVLTCGREIRGRLDTISRRMWLVGPNDDGQVVIAPNAVACVYLEGNSAVQ